MPNIVRNFEQGGFYHLYNRGNRKQPVFLQSFDYQYFLKTAKDNAAEYETEILAYCLMRNHYHFLVRQLGEDSRSVSRFIGCTSMSYAHYFNKRYDSVGCLFQGRFRSKRASDDAYLYHLTQYIHLNPAELTDPEQYPWSSLRSYLTGRKSIADPSYILSYINGQPYSLNSREVALTPG